MNEDGTTEKTDKQKDIMNIWIITAITCNCAGLYPFYSTSV